MNFATDKQKPICPQIEEFLCVQIANGQLRPLEKLPSVRDFAVSISVNPNTVQKAFDRLEEKGLLTSVRGSGWYVSDNTDIAKETVELLFKEKTDEYLKITTSLGISKEEIISYIKEWNE